MMLAEWPNSHARIATQPATPMASQLLMPSDLSHSGTESVQGLLTERYFRFLPAISTPSDQVRGRPSPTTGRGRRWNPGRSA